MISTQKKKQQNRRLLNYFEYFDQYVIIGDAVSSGRQNVVVNGGSADREVLVRVFESIPTSLKNAVIALTLERLFTDGIVR